MQIACQNRAMLSNAESRNVLDGAGRNCWKGQKCQRESVRNAILHRRTEQQELGDGVLIALESIQGNEFRYAVFGQCIALAR